MVLTKSFTAYKRNDKVSAVSVLLERREKPESLLFESGAVAELAPWETETIKKDYTKVCDAYGCLGVLRLSLREDDSYMYLVLVTSCRSIGKIKNSEITCINSTIFISLGNYDDACILEVQKLLNSGSFYFTTLSQKTNDLEKPLDLSLTYQRQCSTDEPDNRFFWNHSLHVHLQKFGVDCSQWLLNIMCGGIEVKTVYAGTKQAKAMVISRLSCERAGTRFNVRGVNDDGYVANFVETEQIIVLDDCVSSFVQTRGSVPLFWEQPGVQVGSHKVKLSRGFEASAPAFSRHISSLKGIYGDQILINLLGRKEGESYLSKAYQDQLKASEHCHNTPLFLFDYHLLCKGGKKDKLEMLKKKIEKYLNAFSVFVKKGDDVVSKQSGTLRANCLDCLDRTNNLQSFIGLEVLPTQLSHLGLADKTSLVSRFVECFKTMWASNGHLVSRTYTGTGAMEGGARFGSKLHDGAVSVRRTIRNNFFDGSKQEAIDILLLGNTFVGELGDRARALLQSKFLHASPAILRELCDRHLEYTKWQSVRVCVGTFNVNGGHHFRSIAYKHQSLDDWLLDFHVRQPDGCVQTNTDFSIPTDIFAIGFEELVDLKAGNIISTNAGQRLDWGNELKKVISRDYSYVLLTCEQLVGVCLYVFVRPDMVHDIRDVAVESVKTGLGGSAGNKGGVAIRFLFNSTSLCFVCSHFAAGQSNIVDRNNDYHDIVNKMEFPMGRTVIPHDYVLWCGDFNYRIDLPMDDVKNAIKQGNWDDLQSEDQLTKCRKENKCFRGFSEGRLRFAPTYKFDPFSDDYDTSEKMRVPAWTDRVLWRRRHPRSKHVTTLSSTEELLVDVTDGDTWIEYSSDSEDEEDGRGTMEVGKPPERRKSFRIREDIANWSAGKLLYYHSAQLKTSDHRPVVALIEIEIQSLDKDKEANVHDDVMEAMGPADPTVVISSMNGDDEINAEILLELLENIGSVVLVRVIDDEFLITFDDGRSALKALSLNESQVDSVPINVKLKSESLLSNTDVTVGNFAEGNSHLLAMSTDPDRQRSLSEILDHSDDDAAEHSVLEPIKISSADGVSNDDLDDPSEESEDEETRDDVRAPVPAARPKVPPPSKPKAPDHTARVLKSSPNHPATKPARPHRPKESSPKPDVPPLDENQRISPVTVKEKPKRPKMIDNDHKKRPTSPGEKLQSRSTEELSKPQVPTRHAGSDAQSLECEETKRPRRPGRPPPPSATKPEKPPPPSVKKPVVEKPPPPSLTKPAVEKPPPPSVKKPVVEKPPPPSVTKPVVEKPPPPSIAKPVVEEPPPPSITKPVIEKPPPPVTKPEEHKAITKTKEKSPLSLRKRLGSLTVRKQQQQQPTPSTLNISTPFDVKHVSHVGAANVQSLLQTTNPMALSPDTTGTHGFPDNEVPSSKTTHVLDLPNDEPVVSGRTEPIVPTRKNRTSSPGGLGPILKPKPGVTARHEPAVQLKQHVDRPVPMSRTASVNTRPTPAPRRKSGNEDDNVTEPVDTNDNSAALHRAPPKLPPRPDKQDNELDSHPETRSADHSQPQVPPQRPPQVPPQRPPQVPPRSDLENHVGDEDFPVPPPRKGRR